MRERKKERERKRDETKNAYSRNVSRGITREEETAIDHFRRTERKEKDYYYFVGWRLFARSQEKWEE